MRGAGDELSIGERIAYYRSRRGLTQVQLANLVGRRVDWLSKIERGERDLKNIEKLVELAKVLRVSLPDLLGQPTLLEDEQERDDIPAIRDALMAPGRLSRVLYRAPIETEHPDSKRVAQLVEFSWSDYQRGRLGHVVANLPRLIRSAQQLEDAASTGSATDERQRSWAISARTHHLAATTLSKVGETAARWLEPRVAAGDPEALSLFGMLHLRTAVAAARHQDRGTALELLSRAGRAADQLGEDANYWQTGFGPTNVELHRLSAGLDLGDVAWVAEHGQEVGTEALPVERRVTHMIDVARALSYLARDTDALDLLLTAEKAAPQLVRHSASVRETVKTMHRRAPVTGGSRSSELLAFAQRCRAVR